MLNRAILMGRLVADPELRQTTNGIPVCRFCIAVDRPFSKDRERQADFINIVAWRSSAEFVSKYFNKGKMIIVEGPIQTRNYEDRSGNKRTAVEVIADNVQFGETKSASSQPQNYAPPAPYGGSPAPAAPAPVAEEPVSYASGDMGDFAEAPLDSEDLPF